MVPREMLVIAVLPGSSLRVSRLRPGTAKHLRKTRTPTRFASPHCTTSDLIPPRRRLIALRTSGSLRQALQFRFQIQAPAQSDATPTATPSATPTPTATATVTPTPTVTPTGHLLLHPRLRQGQYRGRARLRIHDRRRGKGIRFVGRFCETQIDVLTGGV